MSQDARPLLPSPSPPSISKTQLLGFFVAGLFNNFPYVVMLSAALALVGDSVPPSVVLIADILPGFLTQLAAPWFADKFTYRSRIITATILNVSSLLVAGLGKNTAVRLLGVGAASIASAFGELTFLAYSAHFHRNAVSAWSSGTGAAGVAGAAVYLVLSLYYSNQTTMIMSAPLGLFVFLSYAFVIGKPAVGLVPDGPVEVDEAEAEPEPTKDHEAPAVLSVAEKLRVLRQLTPYLWALGSVYFFEYMINQSVDPVLVFRNSSLIPEKHQYTSYQLAYQIGVFVSRSSVNLLPIPNVWWLQVPSLLQAVNCVVLSFAAVHNFLPGIVAALAIIVFEGLMGGAVYVNTFMLIRSPSSRLHGKAKEFALGATSQSYGFAITLAGLIGLYWTPFLSRHSDIASSTEEGRHAVAVRRTPAERNDERTWRRVEERRETTTVQPQAWTTHEEYKDVSPHSPKM
eukprot:CAMPEP_0170749030 /NCGR_PEP_ID=MMETSP0437-20130122/10180_1 /TAXON_ID=0 /ORGANISM="Sexangularia sp." /LENGTH=457 /DNA_ID=CAMNT_0011087931 /DNA_START=45 /DNA_END=1416 /DNA_ORIENTATION=+